jgi:TRAP-type C4-dicarboxylate transport system permease small subunit
MGNRRKTKSHQDSALVLHIVIVCIFGFLALACIIGGLMAVHSESKTEFEMWGAHLTTGNVGVAFMGIGLVIGLFTVRAVLRNQKDLAHGPSPARPEPSATTVNQTNITTGGDNAGRDINKK